MDLFIKKTAADLLHEAENEGGKGLKRVLGAWGLIALGVGVIIGAGLFSVTGIVAGVLPVPVVVGESVDSLAQAFKRAPADAAARGILTNPLFSRLVRSKPVVKKSKCVGCGVCMRSCPGKAIELINKKPSFDYNKCIRCYCCQELCPQTAIEVWQPFFMKWLR